MVKKAGEKDPDMPLADVIVPLCRLERKFPVKEDLLTHFRGEELFALCERLKEAGTAMMEAAKLESEASKLAMQAKDLRKKAKDMGGKPLPASTEDGGEDDNQGEDEGEDDNQGEDKPKKSPKNVKALHVIREDDLTEEESRSLSPAELDAETAEYAALLETAAEAFKSKRAKAYATKPGEVSVRVKAGDVVVIQCEE
jgi:hypothetical protein